jgi:hypothetical protein
MHPWHAVVLCWWVEETEVCPCGCIPLSSKIESSSLFPFRPIFFLVKYCLVVLYTLEDKETYCIGNLESQSL